MPPTPTPQPAPKIGDVVHYVDANGQHQPAFVLANAGAKDPLDLAVISADHVYVATINRDAVAHPLNTQRRVPKGSGNNQPRTWHWPEGRQTPVEV